MDKEIFRQQVEMALSHLRDVVHLRVMDLCTALVSHAPRDRRGWELSRTLLQAIDDLRPVDNRGDTWARRRYDLLTLRYVNGLEPDQVADRLAMSRRHFYRQRQRALDEFSAYLWAGLTTEGQSVEASPGATMAVPSDQVSAETSAKAAETSAKAAEHLRMLRQEAMQQLGSRQRSSLKQVLDSALAIISPLLRARSIAIERTMPPSLPEVAVSPEILKQLLLGLLGETLKGERTRRISLAATPEDKAVRLNLVARWEPQGTGDDLAGHGESISSRAFAQLARLQGVRFALTESTEGGITYELLLPTMGTKTVLVVDDNEEVCSLFRRYLVGKGYRTLVATTGAKAIALARAHNLYAITLDLMMNNEDGWDVLQTLTHEPETAHVPIIICSVLDQKELATMLGATSFLKKPVMRERLIETLAELGARPKSIL